MARGFGSTYGVGASDTITVTSSFAQSSQFSFSCWFYANSAGAGSKGRILDAVLDNCALNFNNASNSMAFSYGFTTTNGTWTFAPPSLSAWHHIAIAYDATSTSNKPVVYIDGSPVTVTTSASPAGSFITTSNPFYIGNRLAADRNWDGMLAEFVILKNAILTNYESAALARGISPLLVKPASLSMYLPLLGMASGEPDWGPSHFVSTLTGTTKRNHAPVSFWMPSASTMPMIHFNGSLVLTQAAAATAITAREKFSGHLSLTAAANSMLANANTFVPVHPGNVTIGDTATAGLAASDIALYDVQITESI